jgi:hypothetical protein
MSRPTELDNLLGDASATKLYTLVLRSPIVAAIAERTAKNMAFPVTSIKVGSLSCFPPRSGIDPCIAVTCYSTCMVCVAAGWLCVLGALLCFVWVAVWWFGDALVWVSGTGPGPIVRKRIKVQTQCFVPVEREIYIYI